MLSFRLINLNSLKSCRIIAATQQQHAITRWFSDSDSSDDEKSKKKQKPKVEKVVDKDAIMRLNLLLEQLSPQNLSAKQKIQVQTAPKKEKPAKTEKSDPTDIKEITEIIAKKIGGNVEKTQSELLSKLLTKDKQSGSLGDIISGMTVDKSEVKKTETSHYSKAQNVRKALGGARPFVRRESSGGGVVNLFGAEPLGLFKQANTKPDPLTTWSKLEERELKLAVTHPPSNYFEKMIQWTEQGKVWKFPIDNEQGWEEELSTDFSEHIMLEQHLDDWCPPKGPIRHFMELACVGLSKNHFMSAREKREYILWYKEYFESKSHIIGDLMIAGKNEATAAVPVLST